jgi:hypothetical protein
MKMAKKTARIAPAVEAPVALVHPDQALITEAGQQIISFLAGVAAFFNRAKQLEDAALELQARAKALPAPKTVEEDVARQELVKGAAADIKVAEAHWNPITSTISQFHKRMTGRRAITIDALEGVKEIGNSQHNTFKQEAERQARLETERIRREQEEKLRQERDAEAARLEAEAERQEELSIELSPKEILFVERYALPGPCMGDAVRAAMSVGYKDPGTYAAKLIARDKIRAAIAGKQKAVAMQRQAQAVREQPLEPAPVQKVKANVMRAAGATDRTTWSAEVFDEAAFIAAVCSGAYGINQDVLTFKQSSVNSLAVSLHEALDRVPGIRAVKKTGVI